MAVNKINNPLPVAPNRELGKWAKRTNAINDREQSRPGKSQHDEPKPNPNVKRRTYLPKSSKTFVGVTIIEWKDGSITVKPEKSAPADFDQGYNAEQNHELLQLAIEHLKTKSSQKTTDQAAFSKALQELNNMQKAGKSPVTRLSGIGNGLLKMSTKKTTEQRPVKAIVKTAQETIKMKTTPQPEQTPLRWGQTPTFLGQRVGNTSPPSAPVATQTTAPEIQTFSTLLRNGRTDTSKFSGYQLAAMRLGLDPHTPGIDQMTADQMKQAAHQINVTAARESAAKQGIHYGPKGETYRQK